MNHEVFTILLQHVAKVALAALVGLAAKPLGWFKKQDDKAVMDRLHGMSATLLVVRDAVLLADVQLTLPWLMRRRRVAAALARVSTAQLPWARPLGHRLFS